MQVYNTLSRKKEDFQPRDGKKIHMFVCGPTVYDYTQFGNAKTFVQMDIIARSLSFLGYDVNYLQNITDIDDKIIARAQELGVGWKELTKKFTNAFLSDMERLNITSVQKYASATEFIDDIIKQVQKLLDKDYAYQIEDGIYFEVAKFKDYGKLSRRQNVKEDDALSRIDENKAKRGWNDFCLWKFSKPDEPTWQAPFGDGRPGWHIEDTAITEHFFGPQYDIHGGAVDLIFPHHEAEITQMEAASGEKPIVRYWLHGGFLNVTGTRMGKSKGNFVTIREVFDKGYSANAVRMLFAQAHYRSPLDFSWEILDAASERVARWQHIVDLVWQEDKATNTDFEAQTHIEQVKHALENDFDMPQVLSHLDKALSAVNDLSFTKVELVKLVEVVTMVLGIDLLKDREDINDAQKNLLEKREAVRTAKDWAKSDELRDLLQQQGISVRDTEQGPVWSRL